MKYIQNSTIAQTINDLYDDARNDYRRLLKGAAKSFFRPPQPADFSQAYLAIDPQQGADLVQLIESNQLRNIVEFGTSFGISTLFLAQGVEETGGHIITTELVASKAHQALENFRKAGVDHLIDLRIGDAMETLKHHDRPIDLLLVHGWKDLYLPLFRMLEPNFHAGTLIYVDNADMAETQAFLQTIGRNPKYRQEPKHFGKAVLIRQK